VVDEYERLRQTASDEIEKMGLLADIHFDYDKAELREGDRQILARNAETLKKFDFLRIKVEGHCDERGSVEYNLALGQRRRRRPTTTSSPWVSAPIGWRPSPTARRSPSVRSRPRSAGRATGGTTLR